MKLAGRQSCEAFRKSSVAGNASSRRLKEEFDGKLHFLSVNNQFPSHFDARAAQKSNKLAKIGAAWTHSKSKWQPKYVMKLDADDFISSRLVGWLDENGTEAGYLMRHGGFGAREPDIPFNGPNILIGCAARA